MTEKVTCPADGCDYSGVQTSVLGHYSGRQDDAHSGGYQHAKTLLADGETSTNTAETDSSDGGSGNPVFGSADPDSSSKSEPEQVGLPCGCESYDPAEAPPKPFKVTCSQCGETYRVSE